MDRTPKTETAPLNAPVSESWNPFNMGDLIKHDDPLDAPLAEKTEAKTEEKPKAEESASRTRGAPEEKAEPKVEEEKPKHPRALIRAALQLGIDEAHAESLSIDDLSEELLVRGVEARVERQAKTLPEEKKADDGKPAWLANEDDYEPELVATLKGMRARMEALEEQNKALLADAGRRQGEARQTVVQKLDAAFAANDAVFGKDTVQTIDKGSKEFARRQAVIDQMNRLEKAGHNLGVEDLFAKACDFLGFAPAPDAKAEPRQTDRQRDEAGRWKAAGVARPTDRADAEARDPDDRAAKAIKEKYESLGGVSVNGTADLDHFPD
jgi:hypothetical protein